MMIPHVTWAGSQFFVYVILGVVIAVVIIVYRSVRVAAVVKKLTSHQRTSFLLPQFSYTKQWVKSVLLLLGLCCLLLAVLRPQWDEKEQTVTQEGRDLFIALDISRSMLAQDCTPHRLACAQEKIRTLLTLLSCERVGLMLFSGTTCVQCPLTTDYNAFHMYLDQLDVETISSGTTALDQVIQKALALFNAQPSRKHKLLVIFTDGEDFSSNLTGLQREAAQAGMTIFTVGVGTQQGAPIPLFDAQGKQTGHQRDAKGNVVISRLNESLLQSLARDCGGTFITMTRDAQDMNTLVRYVQQFEKERMEDTTVSLFEEQYHYFVAASFIFLLCEWFL